MENKKHILQPPLPRKDCTFVYRRRDSDREKKEEQRSRRIKLHGACKIRAENRETIFPKKGPKKAKMVTEGNILLNF